MHTRLREIRLKNKISQKEMAEILKISQSQISNIEINGANTTNETIENFYKHFGAEETIYLISGEQYSTKSNNEIDELYNQLNNEYKIIAKYKIKELIKEQEAENNKDFKNIG